MQSKRILTKPIYNNILPDACIDILFNFTTQEIYFAGFRRETEPFLLQGPIDFLGIRLRPSVCYSHFSIDASKIMEKKMNCSTTTLEKIWEKKGEERIHFLKEYFKSKNFKSQQHDFISLVNELYQSPNEQTVEKLSKQIGYNKRHLYRLFLQNYGVSPKVLLNILRLHFCFQLLLEQKKSLTEIAHLCGFYDQSHFVKEIKRYTNVSPIKLVEKLTSMSDFYKE